MIWICFEWNMTFVHAYQLHFRIVILMRGIPGSGKSYISKMIKDKEQEMGGSTRILSIDDYFMTEVDPDTSAVKALNVNL